MGAGGRRGRRELAITDLVHLTIPRRSIHVGSFRDISIPVCGTSIQGVPRFVVWPHHMAGTGSCTLAVVFVFPCPLGRSANFYWSTCLLVLYTFPIFCQVFLYRKRAKCYSMQIATYYTAQQSHFTEAQPQ